MPFSSPKRTILAGVAALAAAGAVVYANRRQWVKAAGDDEDAAADLLARMFTVELGSKGCACEKSGMAYVARNRAKAWGRSLRDVIYSAPGRAEWGSGCGQNRGCEYNRRLDAADRSPSYPQNLTIARFVVSGASPNNVGKRRTFVHPGFGAYAAPGPNRPLLDPDSGRYLPLWSIDKKYGGSSRYSPKNVGSTPTRFA